MTDWMAVEPHHGEWMNFLDQWHCVDSEAEVVRSALQCPGCCDWQIEGPLEPDNPQHWWWSGDDPVAAMIGEMRLHLTDCAAGAMLMALAGVQVTR